MTRKSIIHLPIVTSEDGERCADACLQSPLGAQIACHPYARRNAFGGSNLRRTEACLSAERAARDRGEKMLRRGFGIAEGTVADLGGTWDAARAELHARIRSLSIQRGVPPADGGARGLDAPEQREAVERWKAANGYDDMLTAYADALATIARLREERDRYLSACKSTNEEVTRVIGEALFGPTPPDAPGDVWAAYTAESIAELAAYEVTRLRGREARIRAALAGRESALADDLRAILEEP